MMDSNAAMTLRFAFVLAAASLSFSATAQPGDYGIDFVTIRDPGNVGYNRQDPIGFATGRGSVDYEYRIGRLEVTTQQWLGFVNAMHTSGEISDQFFAIPFYWGAEVDPNYSGPGQKFRLQSGNPNAGMLPVQSIDWYAAAYFCNWLNNGQPDSFSEIQTGAYDTNTWRLDNQGQLSIADPHLPEAKYWIPTFDEWQKAAYYDPEKDGDGGWWLYPNSSDALQTPGIPGVGETSAGLDIGDAAAFQIPLGSYFNQQSPWGLLDVSGGASEWTEDYLRPDLTTFRVIGGSRAGSQFYAEYDPAWGADVSRPTVFSAGFRIASAIPAPSSFCVIGLCCFVARRRPQRHCSF